MLVRTGLTLFEVRTFSFVRLMLVGMLHTNRSTTFILPALVLPAAAHSAGTGRTLETTDINGNDAMLTLY